VLQYQHQRRGKAETEMANMVHNTGERVEEEESIFLISILLKMSSVIVSFWIFCKCWWILLNSSSTWVRSLIISEGNRFRLSVICICRARGEILMLPLKEMVWLIKFTEQKSGIKIFWVLRSWTGMWVPFWQMIRAVKGLVEKIKCSFVLSC